MDILFITHLLNALLMIAMPVGLAIYLTRKFHLSWRLWWIGVAVFVLSQVGHIPFNRLVEPLFNRPVIVALPVASQILVKSIFLGLSAGLFEELFRYAMFRWWAKDARSWQKGVLAGAGHGGAEAIILGAAALYTFINLIVLRNADLSKLVPAGQLDVARQQVQAYWSMPWGFSLLGALERLLTIPIQISFAVLVLQTLIRGQWFWVWLAVLYHALIDTTAVLASAYVQPVVIEAVVAIFTLISILLIFILRRPELPAQSPPQALSSASVFTPRPVNESNETLDNTRYE